jgi:hypothetical protein
VPRPAAIGHQLERMEINAEEAPRVYRSARSGQGSGPRPRGGLSMLEVAPEGVLVVSSEVGRTDANCSLLSQAGRAQRASVSAVASATLAES